MEDRKMGGIDVKFEPCKSDENLADELSRREGAQQGIQSSPTRVRQTF